MNWSWIGDFQIMIPISISILALLVSIFSLRLNVRNYITHSYYQDASYKVFFVKLSCLDKICSRYCFEVKVHQSVGSDSYVFPYHICITPNIGGIERAQFFELLNSGGESLGVKKTTPIITKKIKKFNFINRKYAHSQIVSFEGGDKYPYFVRYYNNGRLSLSRYHFCIEITDFKNNTEVWYISFSLILRKDEKGNLIKGDFNDLNIVSKKDLIKNMNALIRFNETLDDIYKIDDINKAAYSLQLFEMTKYLNFLVQLKKYL